MIDNSLEHLIRIDNHIRLNTRFVFIRFSDGEIEILRNRKLIIQEEEIYFRDQKIKNIYPKWDEKTFIPEIHNNIRHELLKSALFRGKNYFKGIPTSHNRALSDREFMVRLNGGLDEYLTFSDLLLNSNYLHFRNHTLKHISQRKICLISNFRSIIPVNFKIIKHIKIPDNFFNDYDTTISNILDGLKDLPEDTLILSSASSLSNIVGLHIYQKFEKLSFIDIGTSINDLIGLDGQFREYHVLLSGNKKNIKKYKRRKEYNLKW